MEVLVQLLRPQPHPPHDLHELLARHAAGREARRGAFVTGLGPLDELAPHGAFARAAVHELLAEPSHGRPYSVALLLARAAAGEGELPAAFSMNAWNGSPGGVVIWSDPRRHLYPPAVAAAGLPLDRLYLLHPRTPRDELWALNECLRCPGVAATVASPASLSRVQARRLQLAAEGGGGVGILLRPASGAASAHYAAATRWLVSPAPAPRATQRWKVQLVHGHGGRVGSSVILESSRETHHVRALPAVVDRPGQSAEAKAG